MTFSFLFFFPPCRAVAPLFGCIRNVKTQRVNAILNTICVRVFNDEGENLIQLLLNDDGDTREHKRHQLQQFHVKAEKKKNRVDYRAIERDTQTPTTTHVRVF